MRLELPFQGRMIPSGGENRKGGRGRMRTDAARDGRKPPWRCNPAIGTNPGALVINRLGMAKNMHIRRSTSTRHQLMTRLRLTALNLFTGTALLLAQDPQTGGWRRFNDPPPAPAPQAQPAAPAVQDQDPSQPVARADSYGQSQQPQQQTQLQQQPQQPQLQQQRNDRPPAAVPHYGLPSAVTRSEEHTSELQ